MGLVMVFVKKMTFFNYCFLLNMHCFKGVSPLFLSKTDIFPFFLWKTVREKVFGKVLERKRNVLSL